MARRIVSIIALILPLTLLYLLYNGVLNYFELLLGVIISITIALLFANIAVENPGKLYSPVRWFYGIIYTILYYIVIEAKAHLQMLKLIIDPSRAKPAIVRIPYDVDTDYAVTALANSITGRPGTVVIDVDEKHRVMYIHWIKADELSSEEAYKRISMDLEKYIRRIFD